jgi:hypothetical protein
VTASTNDIGYPRNTQTHQVTTTLGQDQRT